MKVAPFLAVINSPKEFRQRAAEKCPAFRVDNGWRPCRTRQGAASGGAWQGVPPNDGDTGRRRIGNQRSRPVQIRIAAEDEVGLMPKGGDWDLRLRSAGNVAGTRRHR